MNNITYNVSNSVVSVIDCGTIVSSFNENIDFNVKIVSAILLLLLIFEWWSINKVITGKLTHDDKQRYISFVLTFIHSMLLLMSFYIFYWLVLSSVDF